MSDDLTTESARYYRAKGIREDRIERAVRRIRDRRVWSKFVCIAGILLYLGVTFDAMSVWHVTMSFLCGVASLFGSYTLIALFEVSEMYRLDKEFPGHGMAVDDLARKVNR